MNILTNEDLRRVAPAVFAEAPIESVSSRYQLVSTIGAVDFLRNEGYHVTEARQDRVMKRSAATARHALTLVHEDFLQQAERLEYYPRVVLINSHNLTAALTLLAGIFRLVCSNGMVVGRTSAHLRTRHVGHVNDLLAGQLALARDEALQVSATIDRWRGIELSSNDEIEFAKKAASIRFGERAEAYGHGVLLEARRTEDDGRDLWRVFNRVQENTVTRGVAGTSAMGRAIRSRALTDTTSFVRTNQALWSLAERYAEAA